MKTAQVLFAMGLPLAVAVGWEAARAFAPVPPAGHPVSAPQSAAVANSTVTPPTPEVIGSLTDAVAPAVSAPLATAGIYARKPHAAPQPGEIRTLEIKELGNFNYDPKKSGDIPPDVQALSGLTVRLRGYMQPMQDTEEVSSFLLVPSLGSCCYGQPPEIQHTIACSTPVGHPVKDYYNPVNVEGTLTVREKEEDGFVVSIFELSVQQVEEAKP